MTATLSLPATQPLNEMEATEPVIVGVDTTSHAPHPLRWTWREYLRLSEQGFFAGRRVELIEGDVIQMAAMNGPHWAAIGQVQQVFQGIFNTGCIVTMQLPLRVSDESAPEPDIAVVRGSWRDFKENLPTTALMVVEVSDTTLRYDRSTKASLYARANIAEYWLLNVEARQLEVYRRPLEQAEKQFGWGYAEKRIYTENESAAPLEAPNSPVSVRELLP